MPISDEVLLQMMFKQHEGQPIEFIMDEYGKAKRLYLEIEQGLAQGAAVQTIDVTDTKEGKKLPIGDEKNKEPGKRFTKRNLKCDPKEAIKPESITCCLCDRPFKVLNSRHLKSHGISVEDYKKLCGYPENQLLMSKQEAKKAEKRGKELAKARADKLAAAKSAAEAAPAAE